MDRERKKQAHKSKPRDGFRIPAVALFCALTVCLALVLAGARLVSRAADSLENETRMYLGEISAQIGGHIEETLSENRARLARLAALLADAAEDPEEMLRRMRIVWESETIALFDANGDGRYGGRTLNISAEEIFREALYAPTATVAAFDYSPFTQSYGVLIATAFAGTDGQTHVLVAQDMGLLLSRWGDLHVFDGQGAVCLTARRGELIFRSGMEGTLADFDNLLTELGRATLTGISINTLSSDFHAGAQGILHVALGGAGATLHYAPVQDTDWMLSVMVPDAVIGAGTERAAGLMAGACAFAGALLFACSGALYVLLMRERRRSTGTTVSRREQLFRMMSEHIDDVFLVLDEQGMPEFVGENIERITGVPHKEATGKEGSDLAFFGSALNSQVRDFLAAGGMQPFTTDFDWRHRGTGETRAMRLSIYPITAADGGSHRIVMLVDRSAERNTQRLMRGALEAAESASATKTRFLSSMSHEIRTPLNGIIGMTRIALGAGGDVARMTDSLKKIDGSSKHLLALINDVLDMSRIESGATEIVREPFDLGALVDGCAAMQQPQAEMKGVAFRCEKDGLDGVWAVGDALRVNQVLINIVGNAIKFTPAGGAVTLEARVSRRTEDTLWVRFTIADTGMGMTEDFLPKVFEPFAQERLGPETAQLSGTGLGMSITKNLIAMMNGTVGVKSRLNEGTTFTVDLAFQIADAQVRGAVPVQAVAEDLLRGVSVLLAEDNALNTEIMLAILEGLQIQAQNVTDGKQAVDAFTSQAPGTFDAILMDIQMPVMDGLAATRAIRALDRPDARTVPIIAITANAFREDVTRSLESGMTDHISKPVDPAELSNVLARVLPARAQNGGA